MCTTRRYSAWYSSINSVANGRETMFVVSAADAVALANEGCSLCHVRVSLISAPFCQAVLSAAVAFHHRCSVHLSRRCLLRICFTRALTKLLPSCSPVGPEPPPHFTAPQARRHLPNLWASGLAGRDGTMCVACSVQYLCQIQPRPDHVQSSTVSLRLAITAGILGREDISDTCAVPSSPNVCLPTLVPLSSARECRSNPRMTGALRGSRAADPALH